MAIFNPNVPQEKNERNADRIVMIENQNAIFDFINRNHNDLNAPNSGTHKFVTLTNHGNTVGAVPRSSSAIANNTNAGIQQIEIYDRDAQGNLANYTLTQSFAGSIGSTQLTNRFKLKWGTTTVTQQLETVIFPTINQIAFTQFCLIVLPVIVQNDSNPVSGNITIEGMSDTGFKIYRVAYDNDDEPFFPGSYSLNYIAVGI